MTEPAPHIARRRGRASGSPPQRRKELQTMEFRTETVEAKPRVIKSGQLVLTPEQYATRRHGTHTRDGAPKPILRLVEEIEGVGYLVDVMADTEFKAGEVLRFPA